jgi:hypothetical protein
VLRLGGWFLSAILFLVGFADLRTYPIIGGGMMLLAGIIGLVLLHDLVHRPPKDLDDAP